MIEKVMLNNFSDEKMKKFIAKIFHRKISL
jgi:hypothetical protein